MSRSYFSLSLYSIRTEDLGGNTDYIRLVARRWQSVAIDLVPSFWLPGFYGTAGQTGCPLADSLHSTHLTEAGP